MKLRVDDFGWFSVARAIDTCRLWWRRWRSRRELAAFHGRMLRDIGVTAAQAQAEARKPFWKA